MELLTWAPVFLAALMCCFSWPEKIEDTQSNKLIRVVSILYGVFFLMTVTIAITHTVLAILKSTH